MRPRDQWGSSSRRSRCGWYTTACFGGQNGTQAWYQPSIFLAEQFLEQHFLVMSLGELAWEEQLGRVDLGGAFITTEYCFIEKSVRVTIWTNWSAFIRINMHVQMEHYLHYRQLNLKYTSEGPACYTASFPASMRQSFRLETTLILPCTSALWCAIPACWFVVQCIEGRTDTPRGAALPWFYLQPLSYIAQLLIFSGPHNTSRSHPHLKALRES